MVEKRCRELVGGEVGLVTDDGETQSEVLSGHSIKAHVTGFFPISPIIES